MNAFERAKKEASALGIRTCGLSCISSHSFKMAQVKWTWIAFAVLSCALLSLALAEEDAENDQMYDFWPYFYGAGYVSAINFPSIHLKNGFYFQNPQRTIAPSKRVLPYIVHKRAMPFMPVHKRMMSDDIGREEIARILDKYHPRSLRMIPLIH